MSFIDRALSKVGLQRATPFSPNPNTHVFQIVTENDWFTPPKADARKLLKYYSNHPWTRAALAKIAEAVASQAWYLENKKGERIDEHPALDFIRAGSPKLRGRSAIALSTSQRDLSAESFWIVGREGDKPNGRPIMYAPMPSTMVQDIPDDWENGYFDVVPVRGINIKVPARDVIYFRDADPLEPFKRGTSVIGAGATEIATDEASSEYLYSFLKNHARPDYIITGEDGSPINPKEIGRLEQSWLEKFRGATRAGRPLFSSAKLQIKEFTSKPRDNQYVELRAELRQVFSELLGVPPEIMGRLSNSNRATIESADFLFAKFCIRPRLSAMQAELEPFCKREFNLRGLKLKFEDPVAEDKKFGLDVTKAHGKYFSGNEIRRLAGHRPVDDPKFDEFPVNEPPPEETPPGGDPGPEDEQPADGKKPDEKPDEKKAVDTTSIVQKAISPENIVRVSSVFEQPNVTADVTRMLDDVVGELLEEFGDELLEELERGANFQVNGRVVEWLLENVPSTVRQVNATTRKELAASLVEGVALNEAVDQLVQRIEDVFTLAADHRAPIIGRTLATQITGFASLEGARQAGFEAKKWLTSQDQVVRDTHSAMNGQVKLVQEKFVSPSGALADHPGAFGQASEDVNCRCAMRPVLDGEKAADMSDADFMKFVDVKAEKIAKKIKHATQAIFDVQKKLALDEFRML